MAVALFFLFSTAVMLMGLTYVGLTIHHHWTADQQRRKSALKN